MSGEGAAPADPAITITANPARGEASITVAGQTLVLRPSFGALVKAEAELGSLIALIERASVGGITIGEIVGLFWHCLTDAPGTLTREKLGQAVVEAGLAAATPVLKALIGQILKGV